jgi:hypothetical protein
VGYLVAYRHHLTLLSFGFAAFENFSIFKAASFKSASETIL